MRKMGKGRKERKLLKGALAAAYKVQKTTNVPNIWSNILEDICKRIHM